jgi:endonuclease/exonuclease/phosphatase (EEP) superfamily protein YafD
MSVVLWFLVAVFAVWAVVRIFGWERGFPAVQLLAFHPYVAAAALIPVVLAMFTRQLWPGVAAAVVVLALAATVVPRWFHSSPADPPADGKPTLRVMTANLLIGGADPEAIVGYVRDLKVDLLAVQEFTEPAEEALKQAGLLDQLPYAVAYPAAGPGGSALYSRFPLTAGGLRVHRSGFTQAHATLAVPGARPVEVESVHPCAPVGRQASTCWPADLADQPTANVEGPVRLILGDFNATLDHAPLRRLIATGYRDAAATVGAGWVGTWPYDERWYIPAVTIDHVLADPRIGIDEVSVLPVPRSDHRAVFARVRLPQ